MIKTVLVTGANGFVGNHMARELSENNYNVIAIGGPDSLAPQSQYITAYLGIDLLNPEAVKKSIDFSNVEGIIHLAGLAAVGPSFDNPMEYINANIGIEVNLFETALAQGAKPKFLVISSGSLYDPKADLPLTETSRVIPNSPYAVSKLGQEQMGRYYQGLGFEVVIARPFNHIGPGQGPGFIVPDLALQAVAIKTGESDKIMVGNLDAQRDYTDVRDIVRAYRLLLEKGQPGETYNICSGTPLSGHEILDLIIQAAAITPTITEDPAKMRPSDAPLIYGSHQKLTADTGWEPTIATTTTIADFIQGSTN